MATLTMARITRPYGTTECVLFVVRPSPLPGGIVSRCCLASVEVVGAHPALGPHASLGRFVRCSACRSEGWFDSLDDQPDPKLLVWMPWEAPGYGARS